MPQPKPGAGGSVAVTSPTTTAIARRPRQATHRPLQAQTRREKGRPNEPQVLLLQVIGAPPTKAPVRPAGAVADGQSER